MIGQENRVRRITPDDIRIHGEKIEKMFQEHFFGRIATIEDKEEYQKDVLGHSIHEREKFAQPTPFDRFFRLYVDERIGHFIHRYGAILPETIFVSLIRIDNLLLEADELQLDLVKVYSAVEEKKEFMEPERKEKLIQVLRAIGEEIAKLAEYRQRKK